MSEPTERPPTEQVEKISFNFKGLDAYINKPNTFKAMIEENQEMRANAVRFGLQFFVEPSEVTIAVAMGDYLRICERICVDEERNIYTPSKKVKGLWELQKHYSLDEAMGFCKALLNYYCDSNECLLPAEQKVKLKKSLTRFCSAAKYKSILELLLTNFPKTEMNTEHNALFSNGIVWNGKQFVTDPHEVKQLHLTKVIPFPVYTDFRAASEEHEEDYKFVVSYLYSLCMAPDEDKKSPETVSRWEDLRTYLGYLMTLDNTGKKFFYMFGSSTNNGKSTFLRILSDALGGYATWISDKVFAKVGYQSKQDFVGLDKAVGSIAAFSPEIPYGMETDENLVKNVSNGTAPITLARKFKEPVEIMPNFKVTIECNHLPRYSDSSPVRSERLVILEFRNTFTHSSESPVDWFTPERFSMLLSYMIHQCVIHNTKGYTWNNTSLQKYIWENDPTQKFFDECCEPTEDKGLWMKRKDLYSEYKYYFSLYADDDKARPLTFTGFCRWLEDHKIFEKRVYINGVQMRLISVKFTRKTED